MDDTGERMLPEISDPITFWEHIYRYRFAARFARNRFVLDIACGEGYGAAGLLSSGATNVIGVDVSETACTHAHRKYGFPAVTGDAQSIPFQNHSFQLVVSFETLEHLLNPPKFLDECFRVLDNNGLLILSTPDRDVYSESGKYNQFHRNELNEAELISLIQPRFETWKLFTQRPKTAAFWSPNSFAVQNTPWLKVRGFSRLTSLLQRLLSPHICLGRKRKRNISPIAMILGSDHILSSLVNPYVVRPKTKWTHDRAQYLIIVAKKDIPHN